MIKQIMLGVVVAAASGLCAHAETTPKVSIEATGGLMVSPDLDEFRVSRGLAGERASGSGSFVGSAKAGIRLDSEKASIGSYAVFGGYANGALAGVNLGGELDYMIKTTPEPGGLAIGPYAGLGYYFSPNWLGAYDDWVEFDGTVGGYIGVKATVGGEDVRFVMLFGYQFIEYDARGANGGSVSDSTLSMSGLVGQIGVQF